MRHALHPPLVHFPIALLGSSIAFDLAALMLEQPLGWGIAFWNICLGLAIGVLAACAGLVDSARVPSGSPASTTLNRHMSAVLAAFACYGAALWVRGGPSVPRAGALAATMALEATGLLLLMVGGFLGGSLVYEHGVGVSLPRAAGNSRSQAAHKPMA